MKNGNDIGRLQRVVFAFCKGVDTPRSLKLWLLVKNNEWAQVARFKVHPLEYELPDEFAVDYAVTSFLRKADGLPAVVDTRKEAISQFNRTESQCASTNERLRKYSRSAVSPTNVRVNEVIHLAQRKIGNLLADFSEDLAYRACSWGNGATSDLSGAMAYVDTKMTKLPLSCTDRAWKHALRTIKLDRQWLRAISLENPDITSFNNDGLEDNVFDTVKKTVLTDRCIAKEPRMNGFLQQGVGKYIRAKLQHVGIDLTDQTRNQALAGMALQLDLATLDLEAASDTISIEVVKLLLPEPVFTYLNDIRCHSTLIEGSSVQLEKFSSMGNAFTFELESLIFWALASSASDLLYWSTVGVFGDDLIVRKDVAPLLTDTLLFCGFTLNSEKSFTSGVFYESCGKHFFRNIDVTPFYQKCVPSDALEAIRLCNRLLRFAYRLSGDSSLDKRIEPAWRSAVREYSVAKYAGPIDSEGDGYLNSPHSTLNQYATTRGYRVLTIIDKPLGVVGNDEAMYALWLRAHKCSVELLTRNLTVKGLVTCYGGGVRIKKAIDSILVHSEPGSLKSGYLAARSRKKTVEKYGWYSTTAMSALDW
jgi:hypothetical protein